MDDMTHVFEVKTSLADKEIFIYEASGSEELGKPFKYEAVLLAENPLDLDKLLGEPITISIEKADGKIYRRINGIVAEIVNVGMVNQYHAVRATLRPWFWLLSLTSDNLVFQEKSVIDILKQVFQDKKFSDFEVKTTGSYRKRDYCVQYGETTFEFLSRLMEEEGIYYFFDHQDGKHEMILCDGDGAHKSAALAERSASLPFRPPGEAVPGVEVVTHWQPRHSLQTQKVVLDSYNFEKSSVDLRQENLRKQKHTHAGYERYEYGQLWPEASDGKSLAEVRREAHTAKYRVVTANSNAPGLAAGAKMKLVDYPEKEENAEHLITGTEISFRNNQIETAAETEEAFYRCEFTAIRMPANYRPMRITPRAAVRGPQTAMVVGPSNEEIWTDKFGRVKVQFHWDREGKKDENSSCWIRVATTWAGNAWGAISIPRIGQEVIVDFLEGDPDQPIVTGSVYNDKHMPPFTLPDNKTQSGVRSRSTKDGNTKTFNELRFEDKKGSEEVYFHAEKDFKRVVENNDHLIVGKDKKDKGDQTIEIHNDRTVTLDEGDDSLKVSKGNQSVDVKKKISIEAGDELHVKVGMASLTMKKNGDITIKGKNITLDGTGKVTCKALQDFTAKGLNTKINANVNAEMKGNVNAEVSGGAMAKVEGKAMLDLKASGMAKLKGSINMIG